MKSHLSRGFNKVVPYCYGHFLRMLYLKKEVSSLLRGVTEGVVLDAGCGVGDYTTWIARKYPKVKVVGVDIDPERIAVCNKKTGVAQVPKRAFRV